MVEKFVDGRSAVTALPSSVRVGPVDFTIERWETSKSVASPRWGTCCLGEFKIGITWDMPNPMKAVDTLIHEVNHAIWWAYNLHDKDEEERTVSTMARGWAQVYRDNPGLLDWFARCV